MHLNPGRITILVVLKRAPIHNDEHMVTHVATSLKHSRQSQAPNFLMKTWPSRSHGYDPHLKAIRFAHRRFTSLPSFY